jgi:hypothetical protein
VTTEKWTDNSGCPVQRLDTRPEDSLQGDNETATP